MSSNFNKKPIEVNTKLPGLQLVVRSWRGKGQGLSYPQSTDDSSKKAVNKARKELKRAKARVVQRFFEAYVSKPKKRIQEGGQLGFGKHLKGVYVENKQLAIHPG